MRIFFLRLVSIFLFISAMIFGGCSSKTPHQVLAVEQTKYYHTPDCVRLNMANAVFMTHEEARTKYFKPCPGCKPDNNN